MHIAASLRASGSALSCWRWSFRDPPPKGDIVGVRDEQVPAGYEPLLVPVMLGGRPTGANGDLAAARVRLDDHLGRLPATPAPSKTPNRRPCASTSGLRACAGASGSSCCAAIGRPRQAPPWPPKGPTRTWGDDRSCQAFGPGSGGASYPLPTGAPASLSPPASRTLTGLRRAVTGRLERLLGPLGERVGGRKLPPCPFWTWSRDPSVNTRPPEEDAGSRPP
jgi:hypothetical protein